MSGLNDALVESAADKLYALPLDQFIPARDELARELGKQGQRAEADAVRALRKPTGAAWAVNQLAHRRRGDIQKLLAAGATLRDAQEQLLRGGGRQALQAAREQERELVASLAHDAATIAAEAGLSATPALLERLHSTLHAAAVDEQAAAELARGRMLRDREAVGFPALATSPPRAAQHQAPPASAPPRASEDRRRSQELRRLLKQARSDQRDTGRRLEAAQRSVQRAQAQADDALQRLRQAEAHEKDVRDAAGLADAEVTRLEAELEDQG